MNIYETTSGNVRKNLYVYMYRLHFIVCVS